LKKKYSLEEQREWLKKIAFEQNIEKLEPDEKALKTGFDTLIRIIDYQIYLLDKRIGEFKFSDTKELSDSELLDLRDSHKIRADLIEAWDMVHAVLDGCKHPVQRYIDAARAVYGGKAISYREIRFRAVCIGFIEAYQNLFETSLAKSVRVLAESLKGFVDREPSVNQLRSYYQKQNGFGLLGDGLIQRDKIFFEEIFKSKPENLFMELRCLIAETTNPENVDDLFQTFNLKKIKTPPSSHLH